MVKNSKLYNTVIIELIKEANKDSSFKLMSKGNENLGKEIITSKGELQVDKEFKVQFMFKNLMAYGYDFNGNFEGIPTEKIYNKIINRTKRLSWIPVFETFISEGIDKESNFGWYITKI